MPSVLAGLSGTALLPPIAEVAAGTASSLMKPLAFAFIISLSNRIDEDDE